MEFLENDIFRTGFKSLYSILMNKCNVVRMLDEKSAVFIEILFGFQNENILYSKKAKFSMSKF